MFDIIKPGTQIDFVGKRTLFLAVSIVCIVGSFVLLFTKGLNFGIDFQGGSEVHVRVPLQWKTSELRTALTEGGIDKDVRIVQIGEPQENQYLIRVHGADQDLNQVGQKVDEILSKSFKKGDGADQFAILKQDVVGAVAGGLLVKKAFLAMFYALIAILIYVAIRFDLRYAPGAVMALFHDTVVTLGVFVLTQRQFDLTVLAAVLALIGYSNNDTIIVYDRVRETLLLHPDYTIEKAVNRSINETLGRTLMTSISTFVVVLSLWIFGGPVLENFAFTLVVGIIVGTYSSIFIASTFVILITKYQLNKGRAGGGGHHKSRIAASL